MPYYDNRTLLALQRLRPFHRMMLRAGALGAAVMASGCATVFDGTSQEITVNTNPPGATCVFTRNGTVIGTIQSTPALLSVQKRKYDIMISCNKPGYAQGTYLNHSGVSVAIAGNIVADVLLTAGISSIVDSADGADNKYDSAVNISLEPKFTQGVPQPAATPSTAEAAPRTSPGELVLMPAISAAPASQ
jgi:hypothetical protein